MMADAVRSIDHLAENCVAPGEGAGYWGDPGGPRGPGPRSGGGPAV